jgi:hypothetical protein
MSKTSKSDVNADILKRPEAVELALTKLTDAVTEIHQTIAKAVVQELLSLSPSDPPPVPPHAKPVNAAAWLKVMHALSRGDTNPYKEYLKRYRPPPVEAD